MKFQQLLVVEYRYVKVVELLLAQPEVDFSARNLYIS